MNNQNDYNKQKERALKRKLELIELKGGKCEICGYDRNISALDFHHIDPSIKNIQLDSRHLSNTNKEKIVEELNKCILLCSNCHRELHHPHLDKDNINNLIEEMTSKHSSLIKKKYFCKYCGKEMNYTKGKKYCSKECRNLDSMKNNPTIEEIKTKYSELGSWEKVSKYFNCSRKKIRNIIKKGPVAQ